MRSVLSLDQVRWIKAQLRRRRELQREMAQISNDALARECGCSPYTVAKIARGLLWPHVEEEGAPSLGQGDDRWEGY